MADKPTIPDFPTLPELGRMITQACKVVASVRGIPYDFNGTLSLENKFVVLFKTVKEMFDAQDELVKSYKALYDFINQYFTNLDLQNEVNKKIEELKNSGKLITLMKPAITNEVSTWLTANIANPSNPPLDKTLTVENAAAESKTTGNKIEKLTNDMSCLMHKDFNLLNNKYIDFSDGKIYDYLIVDLLSATDYIEISTLSSYICLYNLKYNEDNVAGIAFYDSGKKYITGYKLFNLSNKIKIPHNSRYLRATIPYKCINNFGISYLDNNNKINTFISGTNTQIDNLDLYKLSAVRTIDCDFIKIGKNLFNNSTVTVGYYVDPGTGKLLENPDFWTSDFIPVEPNTTYTLRYKNQASQYDENKKSLGDFTLDYSETTSAASITATTKPKAKYVRICGSLNQLTTDQFEKGDSFTSYEAFSQKIESSLIPTLKSKTLANIIYKIFAGNNTRIKLVGDSIMHGQGGTGFTQNGEYIATVFGNKYYRNPNGYCWANLFKAYLESKFSCSVTNNAILGTSFKELNENFNTLISSDDDIVICMYGTNNRNSLPATTGWIQSVINKCNALNLDLILMTPIPASVKNEEQYTNHIEDICNTIKTVCINNNVPFVDTNQIMLDYCEYRNVDINTLLADGLHPNDDGYLILFNAVCKVLGITRKVTGATW